MASFLVQIDFHHDAASIAILIDADDADSAVRVAEDAFAEHEDWAIEEATVVREAGPEDVANFDHISHFS